MKTHPCDEIEWNGNEWIMNIEHEYERTIYYCPYCGERLG